MVRDISIIKTENYVPGLLMDCYNLNVHTRYMAFNVDRRLQDGWEVVELQDDRSGSYVDIIPSAGAIINSWKLGKGVKKQDLIDGYSGWPDFKANVNKGFKSAKLSPFVCRLKNGEYTWEGATRRTGKFMLNADALHGLLYDVPFTITKEWVNEEGCGVEMEYDYRGDLPGFPFPYTCVVFYSLGEGNVLTIKTMISNPANSSSAIPVCDGWHPYFALGGRVDDWWLQVASDQMLEYDASLIPTGKYITNNAFQEGRLIGDIKLDNGFLLQENSTPFCILKNQGNNISVEFISALNYPFLQLYIPDHRKSIAIENLSSAPDAFNNGMGLHILKPDETISFMVTIRISA